MRIAVINKDSCLGEKCSICVKVCPMNKLRKECIVIQENYPKINEEICSGCGICVKKCPARAISIINLAEEKEKIFHQYSINSFRIFGFPVPREGITAIIGKNGAGKTTVIKLISGTIKPNLGNIGFEFSFQEIANKFRGTEIGNYFKEIEKIKISYKPQDIEKFRSELKVGDFVKDQINQINVDEETKNKKMEDLSGGELQSLLVDITLSKDADLYILDEPCSFLDIKQRLILAEKIRKKAEEGKKIIVVEHDLAILDYLSDYVYIIYGEAGVYGIVSNLKSSRMGINEFLDGFLKSENVRIREESVKFDLRGFEEVQGNEIFSYGDFEKEYENFHLFAKGGSVKENEIIGIIGENSIGKTTFVKVIAGVEKPKLEFEIRRKISYKPQYIKPPRGYVKEILESFKGDEEKYNYIFDAFGLDKIYEKKCENLSGGELQKLAIAVCLLQEAEIYLLDEPSAFLDIEERLNLSKALKKVIKDKKCAFVVDHDLVFIDNISDRIIVFGGVPKREGYADSPTRKRDAMNKFLKKVDITMRRDKDTMRPRINKKGSVLDREQKEAGEYYYLS
jgi:ATP-binding cassette subfamily E protein 1